MIEDNEQTIDELQASLDARKRRDSWLRKIAAAYDKEKPFREEAEEIIKMVGLCEKDNLFFNILFSNTDTYLAATYNSVPQPIVRRRYSDKDALGKAISDVLTRALEFSMDNRGYENALEFAVFDALTIGRGVVRNLYIPSFKTVDYIEKATDFIEDLVESESENEAENNELSNNPLELKEREINQQLSSKVEILDWEQAGCEHVAYTDFLIIGNAKEWDAVPAIAYRHDFTKDDIDERFGDDIAEKINFSRDEYGNEEETIEAWEVWDKLERKIVYVSDSCEYPLAENDDIMGLDCFFPSPQPLVPVNNTVSTIPKPLYFAYQKQANDLQQISKRISNIIKSIKLRGIYDASLTELKDFFGLDDNGMLPVQNSGNVADLGGYSNAIWFMDLAPIATTLAQLIQQREQCKQTIYEIIGLSDILRGQSLATETATAQNIKAQWGGLRIGNIQTKVQRFIRDNTRIQAEIIAEHFSIETLQQMTQLKYPTNEQLQQMTMQYQQSVQMAMMQGQQPPPQPEMPITWEQIKEAMASNVMRSFHVDIETDSTIVASQQSDMAALSQLLKGIADIGNSYAPFVQSGVMSVDVLKEIILSVVRRAKMGTSVEDAIETLQQPQPQQSQQPDPVEMEKTQLEREKMQQERVLTQQNNQVEMAKMQAEMQKAAMDAIKQQMIAQPNVNLNL